VDSLEAKSKEVQKVLGPSAVCKRKDVTEVHEQGSAPKKPRLVFTDLQRRTLQAIFKETKRPSKEMQVTIARQLGLEPTTVGNFFMNARRRSHDKWRDGPEDQGDEHDDDVNNGSNIKYEVYDCNDGMGGGYQEFEEQYQEQVESSYHSMAAIPGPVHSTHVYPPTCT